MEFTTHDFLLFFLPRSIFNSTGCDVRVHVPAVDVGCPGQCWQHYRLWVEDGRVPHGTVSVSDVDSFRRNGMHAGDFGVCRLCVLDFLSQSPVGVEMRLFCFPPTTMREWTAVVPLHVDYCVHFERASNSIATAQPRGGGGSCSGEIPCPRI